MRIILIILVLLLTSCATRADLERLETKIDQSSQYLQIRIDDHQRALDELAEWQHQNQPTQRMDAEIINELVNQQAINQIIRDGSLNKHIDWNIVKKVIEEY